MLLTCDRDYLDKQRFPLIHCAAFVVFDCAGRYRKCGKRSMPSEHVHSAPQFFDEWIKIDAKRDGSSEHSRFLDGTTSRARRRVHRGRLQELVEA